MKTTALPYDPGPPVWKILAGGGQTYPPLEKDIGADFAVVGAGFAGLAAAMRLKQLEPSSKIAVLEARGLCDGPCGRNSGFMIDLPHNLGSKDYVGALEADLRQIQLNREAIGFAQRVARESAMSSEAFGLHGKINAAASAAGLRHNEQYSRHLDHLGEPYELLDEKQMYEISGSRYYAGGLATSGSALIKPGLYFNDFARAVKHRGADIFAHTPVTGAVRRGDSWQLSTPKGYVNADCVILAVNGHIESFGYFRRRLMHIYLYASMTRCLSAEEVGVLGGEPSWGFTPADALGSTVRRISGAGGDRILIRNGVAWAPSRSVGDGGVRQAARVHDRSFKRRFPQLAHVKMEYRWGGLLCLSRNSAPAFGELESGLYSACCQNGLGASHGTLHGKLIAELACGRASDSLDVVLQKPPPQKLPPEPFASIGARIATRWGQIKAGRER